VHTGGLTHPALPVHPDHGWPCHRRSTPNVWRCVVGARTMQARWWRCAQIPPWPHGSRVADVGCLPMHGQPSHASKRNPTHILRSRKDMRCDGTHCLSRTRWPFAPPTISAH